MDPKSFASSMREVLKDAYKIINVTPPCTEWDMKQTEKYLEEDVFMRDMNVGPAYWREAVRKALSLLFSNADSAFLPPQTTIQEGEPGEHFDCDTREEPCRVLPHISELDLNPIPASSTDSDVCLPKPPATETQGRPRLRYLASPADWNEAFRANPARTLVEHVQVARVRRNLPLPATITETAHESAEPYRQAVKDIHVDAAAYMARGGHLSLEKSNPSWEMHLVQKTTNKMRAATVEQTGPPAKRKRMTRDGPGRIPLPEHDLTDCGGNTNVNDIPSRCDETADHAQRLPLPAKASEDPTCEPCEPLVQSCADPCASVADYEVPGLRRSSRRVARADDQTPSR